MFHARPRWLLAGLALATLAACGKHDPNASTSVATNTPAKTVLASVHMLREGQFDALMQHVLPPADYKHMRAEWEATHNKMHQITDEDRQKFADSMNQLTAPDAEQKIWAQIEPQLDKADKKYKAQLPMMIGMGQVMLGTSIDNSMQLTPDQKKQAKGVLEAVGTWASQTQWLDRGKLKQVVGVVTSSARKLNLKTLDQAVALNYDQALAKYGVAWNGMKQVLNIYGLSVDKTLDSATAKTLESDAHTATVEVDYTLLNKPQHLTVDMVNIDGRWYDKDLLDHWRKAMAEHDPASATSTAAAPTAAAAQSDRSAG